MAGLFIRVPMILEVDQKSIFVYGTKNIKLNWNSYFIWYLSIQKNIMIIPCGHLTQFFVNCRVFHQMSSKNVHSLLSFSLFILYFSFHLPLLLYLKTLSEIQLLKYLLLLFFWVVVWNEYSTKCISLFVFVLKTRDALKKQEKKKFTKKY